MSWQTLTLGEVATWGSGGTPARTNAEYFGTDMPWASIADLTDGIVTTTRESLSHSGLACSSAKVVPAGTLLISMYGSIGKLGIAGREMCTSQAIAFAQPRPELVDYRYLFHFLLAHRENLRRLGRGGTQKNIGQTDLKAYPIEVPSLEEQWRIAAILDRADQTVALRTQQLDLLGGLAASILIDLHRKDWDKRPLGSVARFVRGVTFKPDDKMEAGPGTVAVMRTKNVQKVLDRSNEIHVPLELVRRQEQFLQEGDTLISSANSWNLVGKGCFVSTLETPAAIGGFVTALRANDQVDPTYLYYWFTSSRVQAAVRSFSNQTTNIANLNLKRCKSLPVPLPPADVQQAFAAQVKAVMEKARAIDGSARATAGLVRALRQRAFSGQL